MEGDNDKLFHEGRTALDLVLEFLRSSDESKEAFSTIIKKLSGTPENTSFYAFLVWMPGRDSLDVRYSDCFDFQESKDEVSGECEMRYKWATGFLGHIEGSQEPMTGIVFKARSLLPFALSCDWEEEDQFLEPGNDNNIQISIPHLRNRVDRLGEILEPDHSLMDSKHAIKSMHDLVEENLSEIQANYVRRKIQDDELNKAIDQSIESFLWSVFWNRLISRSWRYIYYIPSVVGSVNSTGGLVLATKEQLDFKCIKEAQVCVTMLSAGPERDVLESSWRNELNRAGRAAVFARNFSHITGSHVISNPEFRNSLAGYHYVNGLRRRLDETYSNFLRAENDLFKYITQAPFRPENLWTQGTKALADARDKLGTGDVFQENTRRFHEYLQGRFDFIARAIDVTQDPPEPVWLVRDLLEGFLRQTAYLDNLVADVGLRLDNMEFYFKIEDQEFRVQWIQSQSAGKGGTDRLPADFPFEIEWNKVTNTDSMVPNMGLKTIYELDRMVALPGGISAAHAFYSLLENIIRNSAKYGDLKRCIKDKYKLTVELAPQIENISQRQPLQTVKSPISCFRLRIWDNYSSAILVDKDCAPLVVDEDADNQPWRYLQTKLEKKFVKDNGQPETDDLGMMEMQACSQFLCHPDSDGNYLRANEKVPGKAIRTKFNLNVLSPDFSYGDDKYTFLTFELFVEVPILLGCLTDKHAGHFSVSFYTDDVQKLIGKSPFLMVIDGDWLQKPGNINLLSKENLPNRTLILYATHIRDKQDIRGAKSCTNKEKHTLAFAGRKNDENELFLILYRTWIQKWKKPPKPPDPDRLGKWHLWIGLERQAQQVQEAWEKQANEYFSFGSDPLVELMVKSYSTSQNEVFKTNSIHQIYDSTASNKRGNDIHPSVDSGATTQNDSSTAYWDNEMNNDISLKSALVFDNHGNCFEEAHKFESNSLQSSSRFYQKLSGSVSPDLFRMLSRPPQDKFSFCFFIYSLVEACLTNVVVIDERLAWSLVEGYRVNESNANFAQDLLEHQKAGIYPVFRFRRYSQGSDQAGFYNHRHRDRLQGCIGDASKLEGSENPLNKEGIIFDAENLLNSSLHILTQKSFGNADNNSIQFEVIEKIGSSSEAKSKDSLGVDVILIHEGAMDILTDQMGVLWHGVDKGKEHEKQLQALYQLAPIIIRTSGRGRKSKLLGEHLPFIEFGQVSSSLLTARNKFALVRGLLGSVGRE